MKEYLKSRVLPFVYVILGRNMNDRWMTVQEIAEYLHVSHDLIYRLAQKGKIPASKVGGRWRFKRESIDRWMATQSAPGKPPVQEHSISNL